MSLRAIRGLLLPLVLLTPIGWLRAEPPATAPATRPAQSPQQMLKAYNAAMRAGDADTIEKMHHAITEAEQRVARAMGRSEAYVGKMLDAANASFGADGVAKVGRAFNDISDADIDASEVTIEGNAAVMSFAGGGTTEFVIADGQWKIPVASQMRGSGNADLVIDSVSRRGNFAKVLAQDISSGQVKTADEAVVRIQKRDQAPREGLPN